MPDEVIPREALLRGGCGEVVAPCWVVAGAPGAGKTTVASLLLRRLRPVPARLDKDTLFGGLVAEVLTAYGRPHGEREGPWYDEHVKVHEYAAMTAAAREIREAGCPVLLDAPFTGVTRDAARWHSWLRDLGGEPVQLVWVRSDPSTLLARLRGRGHPRDDGKLAGWDAYVARMRLDEVPPVPHLHVDNRAGAPPLDDQLDALLG
jgi:predicted kinase